MVVTPIELLTDFTALANNGSRMEPHVVKEIQTSDGKTITIKPKVLNKPFSEKTAKIVTEMLVNAVDNGEAKWAKPKGYRIAGKTGTAQIPLAGHYEENKTIASFVGYAPAEDPRFVMLVVVNRPTTSIYGAETAAPIFFDIAKSILMYYNIPPAEGE
jgi:cell division protein FtsI/penicillin-binding protein 2